MQGLQVRSLVKELRSYMPCGVAKKKKKKKKIPTRVLTQVQSRSEQRFLILLPLPFFWFYNIIQVLCVKHFISNSICPTVCLPPHIQFPSTTMQLIPFTHFSLPSTHSYMVTTTLFSVSASQVAPAVKNLPAYIEDIRDAGSIPGWGRCPGGQHGCPLQCSCLENPMDKRAWRTSVHGVAKSQT